VEEDD
jgi:hypothetical protein